MSLKPKNIQLECEANKIKHNKEKKLQNLLTVTTNIFSNSQAHCIVNTCKSNQQTNQENIITGNAVSYTHLTLPTKLEV